MDKKTRDAIAPLPPDVRKAQGQGIFLKPIGATPLGGAQSQMKLEVRTEAEACRTSDVRATNAYEVTQCIVPGSIH